MLLLGLLACLVELAPVDLLVEFPGLLDGEVVAEVEAVALLDFGGVLYLEGGHLLHKQYISTQSILISDC